MEKNRRVRTRRFFSTRKTVISRAESKLGEREYNAFTNNCEHFALWCKTGVSSSEQINKATDAFFQFAQRLYLITIYCELLYENI